VSEFSPSDLPIRLLDIAYDITAASGPTALSMREVQRRAGVSAATAYWHYKNRADLLLAVGRRATAALADALVNAVAESESPEEPELFAVCLGYMHFARDREGLFRAVVLSSSVEELMRPAETARGSSGLAAFEVLQQAVSDFLGEPLGGSAPDDTAVHVWAACHGLAMLLLDSPLAALPEDEKERLRQQHVRFTLASLSANGTAGSI
jgi:AcrR family transcriptional regulator